MPVAPAMASVRTVTGDRKLPCHEQQTPLEYNLCAKQLLKKCVITNARIFIIYSESEMFFFEVMFRCSNWIPTVETVKVLHHTVKLLFINKHKYSLCK